MARHYFHLTNGEDLVVDRKGAPTRTSADLHRRARAAAAGLMGRLPRYGRWAGWLVCVHDTAGRQVACSRSAGRRTIWRQRRWSG